MKVTFSSITGKSRAKFGCITYSPKENRSYISCNDYLISEGQAKSNLYSDSSPYSVMLTLWYFGP